MCRHLPVAAIVMLLTACSPESGTPESGTPMISEGESRQIPADILEGSWARVPLLRRETLDADGQRAYDVIVNAESRYSDGLRGPIGMWVYSPQMAEHMFPASTYLRFGTQKDQRLTELTILATARELRSQYEWTAHEALALQAGLESEIVDLVRTRAALDSVGDTPGFGDVERTIVEFTREVISEKKVSSATFSSVIEHFDERGAMELAGLVGYYSLVNMTIKTFDIQQPPNRELLLPDLW